jgi:hypothetical protein
MNRAFADTSRWFRKMRQDVYYEGRADLALGIFDYLSNLNAR